MGFCDVDWDIVVGLSPGQLVPPHINEHAAVVWAKEPGQAAAVNAAAAVATLDADVLLFLEDDDLWHPDKMVTQLSYLNNSPFVSCSQRSVDENREAQGGISDYPVPSSWMMTADVWRKVGGFSKKVKWLVDTEWLGRLCEAKFARTHLIERVVAGAGGRDVSRFVGRYSEVCRCSSFVPLVDKTFNSLGGMATISRDVEAGREADLEAAEIRQRFGCDPW
jgi:glycosyltransferase involved in cell wall biosynthesis